MVQSQRYRLWLALALALVFTSAIALWLRGTLFDGHASPLPTPASGASPLSTPSPLSNAGPSSDLWHSPGVVLLWVALGSVMALGVTWIILHRQSQET